MQEFGWRLFLGTAVALIVLLLARVGVLIANIDLRLERIEERHGASGDW